MKDKEGYAVICEKYQDVDENISDDLQEIKHVKDIFEFLKNCTGEEGKDAIVEEDLVKDSELIESLEYDAEVEEKIETEFQKNNTINAIPTSPCDRCNTLKSDDSDYDEDEGAHPSDYAIGEFLRENNDQIRQEVMDAKADFTVFIFDKEIKIETSRILIDDDAIVFDEEIPRVNFAGCTWEMGDYVIDKFTKQELKLSGFANIPPIPYKVHDEGYHLKIELFNNGFVRNEEMTFAKYYGY